MAEKGRGGEEDRKVMKGESHRDEERRENMMLSRGKFEH